MNRRRRHADKDYQKHFVAASAAAGPRFHEKRAGVIHSGVEKWSQWCHSRWRELAHELLGGSGAIPGASDAAANERADGSSAAEDPELPAQCSKDELDASVQSAAVSIFDDEMGEERVSRKNDRMLGVRIELRILQPPVKAENAFLIKKGCEAKEWMRARKSSASR